MSEINSPRTSQEIPRAAPQEIVSSAEVVALIEGGEERPYRGWLVPRIKEGSLVLRLRNGGHYTDLEAPSGLFVMLSEEGSGTERTTKLIQVSSAYEKPKLLLMDWPDNPPLAE